MRRTDGQDAPSKAAQSLRVVSNPVPKEPGRSGPVVARMRTRRTPSIMGTVHPAGYEPMLATASKRLEGDGWAFEPKLDGWRAVVHVEEGQVAVYTRPGRNVTESVPQLAPLAHVVPAGTVLDGELVAGSGRASSFYRLSPQLRGGRTTVSFAAFDLLAIAGRSLVYAPYEERKRLLAELCLLGPAWCTLPVWSDVEVSDLLAACELSWPRGPGAKRVRSRYRPGRRSPDWVTMCRTSPGCRRRRRRKTICR